MNRIYSPEPFDGLLLNDSASNGDLINTISFNRDNRNSSIYIELTNTSRVIPTVMRGYYKDGIIDYVFKTEAIIEPGTSNITFDYDEHQDHNFVTYKIIFEVIDTYGTIEMNQVGLVYNIDLTTSNIKSYSTSLLTDINNKPLYRQDYNLTHTFGFIANRTDFEEILNVIEKPYYLVNVLNDCIDLSSGLLVATGINPKYVTKATKFCEYTISNIGV